MVTGGQMPGTAQLAPTAAIRLTPLLASNTVNVPVAASTAVICSFPAGHSKMGMRDSKTLRLDSSVSVRAFSAREPILRPALIGSLVNATAVAYLIITPRPILAVASPGRTGEHWTW